ncbi:MULTISPECIES: hypothetical protein [unclassified Frondihabitans]|uniref:hypothetical protein n=1 Tax=unclassified Frondihabitans TaxID=2626248 RepID=UPI0006FAB174|nr:hypothetical protein [Frondihabitans sp. Leaf304]KQQ27601.1 hypothetical protein ASF54_02090 [Frondihabitans sp. Leaf304]
MFGKRLRGTDSPITRDTGFGIGAQVYVVDSDEDPTSPFPDGPTGVVVRPGGSAWQPVSVIGGSSRVWTIQFDTPQYTAELHGPIAMVQLPERYLRLAPPVE